MRPLLLAALLVAAAAAGCFGGDDDDDVTPTPPPEEPPENGDEEPTDPTPPPPRGPVTWDVEVDDNQFTPSALTIQAGDTVRWTQVGENPHTVTAGDGSFDSHPDCDPLLSPVLGGCMANGDTFQQTFDEVGSVGYHCEVHGGMSGSIEVLERHDPTPDDP